MTQKQIGDSNRPWMNLIKMTKTAKMGKPEHPVAPSPINFAWIFQWEFFTAASTHANQHGQQNSKESTFLHTSPSVNSTGIKLLKSVTNRDAWLREYCLAYTFPLFLRGHVLAWSPRCKISIPQFFSLQCFLHSSLFLWRSEISREQTLKLCVPDAMLKNRIPS